MVEETKTEKTPGQRKILVGQVVSTKMAKTIVVEVHRQKAHPLYRRVVKRTKKFYAHDEEQTARTGDFVRIEETRPLSRLKRWTLKEIVKRSALATAAIAAEIAAASAKETPSQAS
jgi:small subunit ribosomal protein S17